MLGVCSARSVVTVSASVNRSAWGYSRPLGSVSHCVAVLRGRIEGKHAERDDDDDVELHVLGCRLTC